MKGKQGRRRTNTNNSRRKYRTEYRVEEQWYLPKDRTPDNDDDDDDMIRLLYNMHQVIKL